MSILTLKPSPKGHLAQPAKVDAATLEAAKAFANASHAAGTTRVYASCWKIFEQWCSAHGASALPAAPETVALFVTVRAKTGMSVTTIKKDMAAIAHVHGRSGFESPTHDRRVEDIVHGIARSNTRVRKQALPIGPDMLKGMIRSLPKTAAGIRDRTMLLVGFGLALRRSELVAIDIEHVRFDDDCAIVYIPRSKTDQDGKGAWVRLEPASVPEFCPVAHLRGWIGALAVARATGGPLFRPMSKAGQLQPGRLSDKAVLRLVKSTLRSIGVDPKDYSGHSLRSGFVTSAVKAGASYEQIRKTTRHAKLDTVAMYDRQQGGTNTGVLKKMGL